MLTVLTGRSGSGKTAGLIKEITRVLSEGRRVFVLVPEQESVVMEKRLLDTLGNRCGLLAEVLNFERLPERVFRETGGNSERFVEKGGKVLLMREVLKELSPVLEQYSGSYASGDCVRRILGEIESVKRQALTPASLATIAGSVGHGDPRLAAKLGDLQLIMARYGECFTDSLDPSDSLARLTKRLSLGEEAMKKFFENTAVFVDGYYTFTGAERMLLEELMSQTDEMWVTLCIGGEDFFEEQKRELRRLLGAAERRGVTSRLRNVNTNTRSRAASVSKLERTIWNMNARCGAADGSDGAVKIFECADPFAESAAAAAEVLRLVRGGLRYRDIGIVMRSGEMYEGVTDAVFERYGIPCFMSVKEELSTKSVVGLMLAASELAAGNFSIQAVKKYIRSPFCGLEPEESDALDRYITMWEIRGADAYRNEFTRSAEGYSHADGKFARNMLKMTDSARAKFFDSVSELTKALRSPRLTFASGAEAMYAHLTAIGADKKILDEAQARRDDGDEGECARLTSLWGTVVSVLDQLWLVGAEKSTDARGFHDALRLMTSEYETGRIPTGSDEVQIGEASVMRFGSLKALLILGVNDGVFPASPDAAGLFGESECRLLSAAGYESAVPALGRLRREQFIFYRCITVPSEHLGIFYSLSGLSGEPARPSAAVGRISTLLPRAPLMTPDRDPTLMICNDAMAVDFASLLSERERSALGLAPVAKKEETQVRLLPRPGAKISFSPSALETYSLCPFSYYASYMLQLRELRRQTFDRADEGIFIHSVLEKFMRENGPRITEVTDEQIDTRVRQLRDEYAADAPGGVTDRRLGLQLDMCARACAQILRNIRAEFSVSDFRPCQYEYRFEGLKFGSLELRGVIDRIDTYESEGRQYVKVVDYKTGIKKLSLSDVANGLSLQMLIYLYAYCDEDERRSPAAVLYMPAHMPRSKPGGDPSDSLKRNGVVLGDPEITKALESGESGRFMPFKRLAKGGFDKRSSLVSKVDLEAIRRFIFDYAQETASRMRCGYISVSPLKSGKHDPCRYCKMRPVCRADQGSERMLPLMSEELAARAREFLNGRSDDDEVDKSTE